LNLDDVVAHSLDAGRQAAALLQENFGKTHEVSIKQDNTSVTRVDRDSQQLILGQLGRDFPGVPFIAEEQENRVDDSTRDGYYFVVDPLDGTATFVSGIPFFCVSIALCKGPQTVAGVLVDPNRGEEFTAILGRGSFLNGRRLAVSTRSNLSTLTLNVNHTKFDAATFDNINKNILKKIRRFHKLGSLCLEVAYVASGRLDGSINNDLSMWDIAAAGLILQEAGGRWSLLDGSMPRFPVLEKMHICASNGIVHDELLAAIRNA
jgi:myo-inositol-1(or 4)-monophosphatase